MNKTQKEKVVKGAIIGGVVGALVGVPFLGAALGAGHEHFSNKNKKKKS